MYKRQLLIGVAVGDFVARGDGVDRVARESVDAATKVLGLLDCLADEPVSYTHLDVYKRQLTVCVPQTSMRLMA